LPDTDRGQLRDRLAVVLREAGDIALTSSKKPIKHWTKSGDSPVSEADIAVNDFLVAQLPSLMPQAGWLSEETEDDLARTSSGAVWVVDPIDGTRAYIAGRADWSISVALVEDERPAVAALYAPVTNEMFLAQRGGGATLNGRPVRAATTGAPVFDEALAWIDCQVRHTLDLGTHTLFVGEVVDAALRDAEARPASMSDTRMKYGGAKRH